MKHGIQRPTIAAVTALAAALASSTAVAQPPALPGAETSHSGQIELVLPGAAPAGQAGFLGSQSCSSVNCHGGDPDTAHPVGAVYHRWLHDDPHARAAELLHDQQSVNMAKLLRAIDPVTGDSRIHLDQRCLTCHAPAAVPASGVSSRRSDNGVNHRLITDGVGCEACHGAARDWLEPHRSADWKNSAVWTADRKASVGFRDLEDLAIRSRTCSECHVGGVSKDVNHDLIAAGHPRLTYEFAAYNALLPVHWRRSDDRARHALKVGDNGSPELRSDFEAHAWLIGQWTAAEQSMTLLIDRAGDPSAPWPELAEYACYSCHHNLQVQAAHRPPGRRPGQMAWAPWSLALLEHDSGFGDEIEYRQNALKSLRDVLQQPDPCRDAVMRHAGELKALFAAAAQTSATQVLTAEAIRGRLHNLLEQRTALVDQDWETSAQLYLAVVALEQGYFDASGEYGRPPTALVQSLVRVRDDLRFGLRADEISDTAVFDSPSRLDRGALAESFDRIGRAFPPAK